jgi:hypothetical protein
MGNNSLPGDSLKPIELNQIAKPFEIDFNSKIPIESVEDKIIISPFCSFTITENPLKQLIRTCPIDLIYRKSYSFQSEIAIPSGYKLMTKPEDLKVNNSMVQIIFATNTQKKDAVLIIGSYEFKKDVYGILDYAELKGYFNRIVDKFNEKLIFVKDKDTKI